jgi:hypothetical protein
VTSTTFLFAFACLWMNSFAIATCLLKLFGDELLSKYSDSNSDAILMEYRSKTRAVE